MPVLVLKATILGIIQGFTEFLPVSSSGHLVLFQELLGFDVPGLTFEIVVHTVTLLALLFVYWQDVVSIPTGFVRETTRVLVGRTTVSQAWGDPDTRLAVLLVVGSIPAAAVGFFLRSQVEQLFGSLLYVGLFWIVTSALLLLMHYLPATHRPASKLGLAGALVVGLFQSAAIAPGISRSGSTIVGGVMVGLKREEAANFSFLLSVPAIFGATFFDLVELPASSLGALPWNALLAGAAAAALAGYIAINWVLALVRQGRLSAFALYTLLLGLTVIAVELL